MSDITPTQELDCRNLSASQTLAKARQTMSRMKLGEVLKVVATDPGSVADMAHLPHEAWHVVDTRKRGDELFLFLKKTS